MLETGYCSGQSAVSRICEKYGFDPGKEDRVWTLGDGGEVRGAALISASGDTAVIKKFNLEDRGLKDFFVRSLLFAAINLRCSNVIIKQPDDDFIKFGFVLSQGQLQARADCISLKGECSV